MLKLLLCVTALLRFFKIDPASGDLVALSRSDLHTLVHLVLIIGALELVSYDAQMGMRQHRRKMFEKIWRKEAMAIA